MVDIMLEGNNLHVPPWRKAPIEMLLETQRKTGFLRSKDSTAPVRRVKKLIKPEKNYKNQIIKKTD
jgi:hypothetical protein